MMMMMMMMMMMVMMMMMMNCFCDLVDQRKVFAYFQPGALSEVLTIANLRHTPEGFEPAQNLSSGLVE